MTETSPSPPAKRRFKVPFSLIFLIIIAIWMISVLKGSKLLPTGSEAPAWTLRNVENDAGMLSLSDLKGKTVVLDFWGIGCPPCMQEMHELEAVWQELKDKNVAVVGINAWGESRTQALRLKRQKKLTYPMAVGKPEMIAAYKVGSLPTLYLIDPKGKIVATHEGFWDRESLKKAVLDAAE